MTLINFILDDSAHEELKSYCKKIGISKSALLRLSMRRFMDRENAEK